MLIRLNKSGKKFGREWIFRNVDHVFEPGSCTAILGANGSGKSTLLQVISGYVIPSEGTIEYIENNVALPQHDVHRHFSFASPYQELMEEFTLRESVEFQNRFRKWKNNLSNEDVISRSGLAHAADKQIRHYSSGMKQRARLIMAILAESETLLLDEPTSNLDKSAQKWYGDLITEFRGNQTVIVCSNQITEEYFFCTETLEISRFKPVSA
jgi:ABC-type multidrug transport system ATPase subunit